MAPSSQTTMEATVSAPWMWEISKHSMRLGRSGSVNKSCSASSITLAGRLQHAEALIKTLLGILACQVDQGALFPAPGHAQLHFVLGTLAQQRLQCFAIGKVYWDINRARHILLVDIKLLQQGGEEDGRIKSLSQGLGPQFGSRPSRAATRAALPRKIHGDRRSCRRAYGRG